METRLLEQVHVQLPGARQPKRADTLICSTKSGRRALWAFDITQKNELEGRGLGKEGRKEFYVPEDRAASPDLGVLEGRSPEGTRAGPP